MILTEESRITGKKTYSRDWKTSSAVRARRLTVRVIWQGLFFIMYYPLCVPIQWEIWVTLCNRMCLMYPYTLPSHHCRTLFRPITAVHSSVPSLPYTLPSHHCRTLFRPNTAAYYWANSVWRLCFSPKHRNKQVQKQPLEQQPLWKPRTYDVLVSRIFNMAQYFLAFPGLANDCKNYSHLFLCN
jgi:hypothetical protein